MRANTILIHQFLEESAAKYPDKVALVQEGRRITYRELNGLADRFAGCLRENRIEPGERVILLLENCLEYVVSYYGILKTGAVAVPLSPDLKSDRIRYLLEELEPTVIVFSFKTEKTLQEIDRGCPSLRALIIKNPKMLWGRQPFNILSWDEAVSVGIGKDSHLQIDAGSLGSIVFTSGSRGKPKGVMLSHRNIVSNTLAICRYLELSPNDIQMAVLPFYYVMGKSLLNTHMAVGGTVVLNNKFAFPVALLKEMIAERVTGFAGVPSTYAYLLHRSPLARFSGQMTTLRYCTQAGGHMARELKESLRRVLPDHVKIFIMYGATEASARLSYLNPERYREKMDSIGQPIPGVHFDIVSPSGEAPPDGQIGELMVSGPNIMLGYWKDPEGTKQVLRGVAYLTGDLAYRDAEGFYYVVGRKDGMIKTGGKRVNPQEVEEILHQLKEVQDVAILGTPDPILGQALSAFIVPVQGTSLSEREVLRFCSRFLQPFMIPKRINFRSSLPLTPNGKIDKERLSGWVMAESS
jgi:long-chain acyl-CoA synthetase